MHDRELRTAAEWARHWDIICLGTLTIATAITGTAVVIASNSDIPAAIAAGDFTYATLAWGVSGMIALALYLATTLVAGLTIHLFQGQRGENLELKRLGITIAHVLFALEAAMLAVMLVINVMAMGPSPN